MTSTSGYGEMLSPELDYTVKVHNHSTVVYRSIVPQGASSTTLGTSSGVIGPIDLILPPTCFCPSKSRLTFDVNLGALVSGSTGTTNLFRWVNANLGTMLNRVTLYDSATSAVICDVNNFEKWTSQIAPATEPLESYLGKTTNQGATNVYPSVTEGLAKCVPLDNIVRNNVIGTANFSGETTGVVVGGDYTGRRLFYISPSTTNEGTTVYLSVSFNFDDIFRFTALALDKNLYNPANMVLQLYFNPNDSFQFGCPSATDASTKVSVGVGATVSNIKIQLACEANLAIQAQTINMIMNQGVTIPVAYPTVTRQSFSQTTAPSYNLVLTAGYGKRILFLATSPFNSTALAIQNNHPVTRGNAGNNGTLVQYQTTLNSVPIKTPAGFDCSKGEDWTIGNKMYLQHSPTQSLSYYLQDWVHFDNWTGETPISHVDQTKVDGIDVSNQSQTFQFTATTSNIAQTWITSIVGQKLLALTKQGAMIS